MLVCSVSDGHLDQNDLYSGCCVTWNYCVSDVDTDKKNDKVASITISPGQSLLLRCRVKGFYSPSPVWEDSNRTMDANTLACSSKAKEVQ